MKIITFWGGLGNQIFEYAYYSWLKEKYPNEKYYAYYPSVGLAAHNGLEIDKRFDVALPETSTIANAIGYLLFNTNRIFRRLHLPFPFTCTQNNVRHSALFHCDYWQNKKYIPENFNLNFKLESLGADNENILRILNQEDAVAVHVRQGDYTNADNVAIYGGICTDDYYNKALDIVTKKVTKPRFIFFSDDPEYVRSKYNYPNMIMVDWNKGERSIFDIYLMSRSKYMVLANSTFSYWAARLNKNVISVWCPFKWTNINEPDIILETWNKIK